MEGGMDNGTSATVTTGAAVSAERAAQDAAPVLAAADPIDAVTAVLRARGLRAGEVTMEAVDLARREVIDALREDDARRMRPVTVLGCPCEWNSREQRYDGARGMTPISVSRTKSYSSPAWMISVVNPRTGGPLFFAFGSTLVEAEAHAEEKWRDLSRGLLDVARDLRLGVPA